MKKSNMSMKKKLAPMAPVEKKKMAAPKKSAKVMKKASPKAKQVSNADAQMKRKPRAQPEEREMTNQKVKPAMEGQHHEIIQMLMDDHKPLKRLITTMKNSEANLSARKSAFAEFVPLLTIHAKSEEFSLYNFEKTEIDMREEAFEGDVEHGLAEQLIEEIKQTTDKDLWSARVKVLAEMVEHHIKEEEEESFPEFKKSTKMEDRVHLGEVYLEKKSKIKGDVIHPPVKEQEAAPSLRH